MQVLTNKHIMRYRIKMDKEMLRTLMWDAIRALDNSTDVPDDWRFRVVIDDDNPQQMGDSQSCVLGQLFGDYMKAPEELRALPAFAELTSYEETDVLTALWQDYLTCATQPAHSKKEKFSAGTKKFSIPYRPQLRVL